MNKMHGKEHGCSQTDPRVTGNSTGQPIYGKTHGQVKHGIEQVITEWRETVHCLVCSEQQSRDGPIEPFMTGFSKKSPYVFHTGNTRFFDQLIIIGYQAIIQ